MGRKLVQIIGGATQILSRPIITFYDQENANSLTEQLKHNSQKFSSAKLMREAAILKKTAAQANACCLAANQALGKFPMASLHKSVFSPANPTEKDLKWIADEYKNEEDYECITHPKVLRGKTLVESMEESLSFPFLHFKVKRYSVIQVQYSNQQKQVIKRELKGHSSRAFQQVADQLRGISPLDWRKNFGSISLQHDVVDHFPKSNDIIEEYCKELQNVFKEYPELTKMDDEYNAEKPPIYHQLISCEEDYIFRLSKYYRKEIGLLNQRINSGVLNNNYDKTSSEETVKPKVSTMK